MKTVDILAKLAPKFFLPKAAVVIVAAGSSTRMNGVDKMLADLSGKPVVLRSAEAFQKNSSIQEIVVVARADIREEVEKVLREGGIDKLTRVVEGGDSRLESVWKGLTAVSDKAKLIAIHDGARPLVSQSIINDTLRKAQEIKAAVPAMPVRDTVRVVDGGVGVSTPDRATLYAMQTPQIFDADLIRAAVLHCVSNKIPVTDDVSAVETMGMKAAVVAGSEENIKITTRLDLAVASALARKQDQA